MADRLKVDRRRGRTHLTHEERSAATQERLIEAAIFCLHKYGYAATTTTLVAEEAGFSRGAMLHQFGTKVDLMLAVAQYVVEKQNAFFRQALKAYPRGRERFIGLTDVTWEALSQPAAIALLEIMMASRSDPELGERFPALADELARSQREGTWETAQQAGITDRATVEAMSQLNRAAMQGLSILLMFSKDADAIKPGLDLLHWYKEMLTERLLRDSESEREVEKDD
ncbi:TetR/AcrR family transcriptional regulator [Phenylobacterium sp. VNQ135]|uniref:TetR/AcrR family transcriptional regulator n=1 Tax=Phenylobacterium sp. VNQ135 TaxID=3400922 RepID=UPI003BFC1A86